MGFLCKFIVLYKKPSIFIYLLFIYMYINRYISVQFSRFYCTFFITVGIHWQDDGSRSHISMAGVRPACLLCMFVPACDVWRRVLPRPDCRKILPDTSGSDESDRALISRVHEPRHARVLRVQAIRTGSEGDLQVKYWSLINWRNFWFRCGSVAVAVTWRFVFYHFCDVLERCT